jgi:hypothetical protein
MKHYTVPAFVLMFVSALCLFLTLQSFGRARRAAADLAAAHSAAAVAHRELTLSQKAAAAAQANSAQADAFLKSWTTELDADSNIEHVFGVLDTAAVNDLLSPSGKNFTFNKNYFFNGHHLSVQNVNITVAGDFSRTLNWLGSVENTFPLARVEQISYTGNGNSLSLAVQFVFPRKFDSE